MVFTLSFLDRKYPFWMNLVRKKKQNCHLKLKSCALTNLNIRNSTAMFIFSVLDIFASFVRKIHLAFSCYLIHLPAVYSYRLEASGFNEIRFTFYVWNNTFCTWLKVVVNKLLIFCLHRVTLSLLLASLEYQACGFSVRYATEVFWFLLQ